jgi:hypothetical protein
MNNKLSELSKPVAWMHRQLDISKSNSDKADLSVDVRARYSDALYSQEYVSALLSQIEADREIKARLCRESNSLHDGLKAAEKRIAELEQGELAMRVSSRAVHEAQENHINQQQDIIESLEKKNVDLGRALGAAEKRLATPVRLKKVDSSNVPFAGDGFNAAVDYCAKAVRAAGFTVDGDE